MGIARIIIFIVGALGYGSLEILYRGYTHWTMILTGGVCFYLLVHINGTMANRSILIKSLVGAVAITAIELFVGLIVNTWLGWQVWDYSNLRFQLFSQISLFYSIMWFGLCLVANSIMDFIRFLKMYKEKIV